MGVKLACEAIGTWLTEMLVVKRTCNIRARRGGGGGGEASKRRRRGDLEGASGTDAAADAAVETAPSSKISCKC